MSFHQLKTKSIYLFNNYFRTRLFLYNKEQKLNYKYGARTIEFATYLPFERVEIFLMLTVSQRLIFLFSMYSTLKLSLEDAVKPNTRI